MLQRPEKIYRARGSENINPNVVQIYDQLVDIYKNILTNTIKYQFNPELKSLFEAEIAFMQDMQDNNALNPPVAQFGIFGFVSERISNLFSSQPAVHNSEEEVKNNIAVEESVYLGNIAVNMLVVCRVLSSLNFFQNLFYSNCFKASGIFESELFQAYQVYKKLFHNKFRTEQDESYFKILAAAPHPLLLMNYIEKIIQDAKLKDLCMGANFLFKILQHVDISSTQTTSVFLDSLLKEKLITDKMIDTLTPNIYNGLVMPDLFDSKEIMFMWETPQEDGFYTKKFFEKFKVSERLIILLANAPGKTLNTMELVILMMSLRHLEMSKNLHNDNGVIESKENFEDQYDETGDYCGASV